MNDFTKEEQELLNHLSKPRYMFSDVQKKLDEMAIENGYESHHDFLIKTGWLKAIANYDFSNVRNMTHPSNETTFELRDRDE